MAETDDIPVTQCGPTRSPGTDAITPTAHPATGAPGNGNPTHRRKPTTAPAPHPPAHTGHGMADNWLLHSFLELGALPGAVPSARLHARQVLWEWGQAKLTDSAELVVTELLTNAVNASQWPQPVRLWLRSDRTRLLVLVWDANPHPPPARIDADDDAESGRGLLLVEAISEQWNWYLTRKTGGKAVWSLIIP